MELTPYVGDKPVRSETFSIYVNESDLARVAKMVATCATVTKVDNKVAFDAATFTIGRLKALLNEIEDAKKAAKRPFMAVDQAIQNKARQVAEGLVAENERITALLNAYAAQVEAKARAEAREREEKRRAEIARLEKIAADAQAAQARAEAEARAAKNEAERLAAIARAERAEDARLDAELDKELAAEITRNKKSRPVTVTGGRIDHPWKFRLLDPVEVAKSPYWRCLRYELDILTCRDVVRAQLERNPNAQPSIPGIEITRETSVNVRASA